MRSGIEAAALSDDELLRELESLHSTRHTTLLHGPADALGRHIERMYELEHEYLRRNPERDVDPDRTRAGARTRSAS
jgi:hypothetical protein